MKNEFHARVIVISGPSGVGKSTIIHGAMEQIPALQLAVSFTTRERREGEEDGRDYNFIDRETFEAKIAEGEYLEWARVFGNYYGTGKSAVQELLAQGKHALLDVDTQGALSIKTQWGGVAFIFIRPPSLEDLEARLRGRGTETEESLATRLSRAESEIARAGDYDHIIVNDDAEKCTAQLVAIIRAEQARPKSFTLKGSAAPAGPSPAPPAAAALSVAGGGAALPDRLVEVLSGQLGPSLRAEMVALIGEHLKAVLERDLDNLIRETLQTYREKTG